MIERLGRRCLPCRVPGCNVNPKPKIRKRMDIRPKSPNRLFVILLVGSNSLLLIGCTTFGMLSPLPDAQASAPSSTQVVNWAPALIAKPTYTPFPPALETSTPRSIIPPAPASRTASPAASPSTVVTLIANTAVPGKGRFWSALRNSICTRMRMVNPFTVLLSRPEAAIQRSAADSRFWTRFQMRTERTGISGCPTGWVCIG